MYLLSPLIITIPILFIAAFLTYKQPSLTKSSSFECGMDTKSSARLPFSNRFFLLAVLFLVFDVETILLFPLPLAHATLINQSIAIFLFLMILLGGLLHEWREGSLNWAR